LLSSVTPRRTPPSIAGAGASDDKIKLIVRQFDWRKYLLAHEFPEATS